MLEQIIGRLTPMGPPKVCAQLATPWLPTLVTTTTDASTRVKRVYTKAQLQAALFDITENGSRSIRATAATYAVPGSTLRNRFAGHTSCSSTHEH